MISCVSLLPRTEPMGHQNRLASFSGTSSETSRFLLHLLIGKPAPRRIFVSQALFGERSHDHEGHPGLLIVCLWLALLYARKLLFGLLFAAFQ